MNEDIVKLWLRKADNDFKTGKDELSTENPATDTACFHITEELKLFVRTKIKIED